MWKHTFLGKIVKEKVNPTARGHLSSEVLKIETTTTSDAFLVEAGLRQIQTFFHFTWQGNSQLVFQHRAEPGCKTAAFQKNGSSQFWPEKTIPFPENTAMQYTKEAEMGALLSWFFTCETQLKQENAFKKATSNTGVHLGPNRYLRACQLSSQELIKRQLVLVSPVPAFKGLSRSRRAATKDGLGHFWDPAPCLEVLKVSIAARPDNRTTSGLLDPTPKGLRTRPIVPKTRGAAEASVMRFCGQRKTGSTSGHHELEMCHQTPTRSQFRLFL